MNHYVVKHLVDGFAKQEVCRKRCFTDYFSISLKISYTSSALLSEYYNSFSADNHVINKIKS